MKNKARQQIRAVIFDLFGTVVENLTYKDYIQMLEETADSLGVDRIGFSTIWGDCVDDRYKGKFKSLEEILQFICSSLNAEVDGDTVSRAAKIRWKQTEGLLSPRRDTLSTFSRLKAAGMNIGLISDCNPEVPLIWEKTEMASYMDVVTFSSDVGMKKPDPNIYKITCGKLGVKVEECIFIGDGGSKELTGAQDVGMTAVLIETPNLDKFLGHRNEAHSWQGARIKCLSDVFSLL